MQPALLLLGPTGSGKTPLGDMLEERGLGGRRCVHFDFGANLRAIVERNEPDGQVTADDIQFLRHVLQTGALLEDEHFPIAARILQSFLANRRVDAETIVVLNGLPRHVGQAVSLERYVDVRTVVELDCEPETVLARIESNAGGDRSGRSDDSLAAVRAKLAIYHARTKPLVEHYQARGVRVIQLAVTERMTAEKAWRRVSTPI